MQIGAQRGLATVRFVIEPSASRFTVQAFATGLLASLGHSPTIAIRDFAGEAQFIPGTYGKAFIRLVIKMSNLEVLNEMKRDDRQKLERTMYDEVLEAAQFPEAVFESTQVAVNETVRDLLQVQINGVLTFHGVTQKPSFEVSVRDMGSMLRISGEFPLRQSDYGIKPVSIAGGALRLKDELKFTLEMVARRQE
jgi:polyisoprenoid-binding protein YceI